MYCEAPSKSTFRSKVRDSLSKLASAVQGARRAWWWVDAQSRAPLAQLACRLSLNRGWLGIEPNNPAAKAEDGAAAQGRAGLAAHSGRLAVLHGLGADHGALKAADGACRPLRRRGDSALFNCAALPLHRLQPFVESNQPVLRAFPPRHWALAAPVLAGVGLFGTTLLTLGCFLVSSEMRK